MHEKIHPYNCAAACVLAGLLAGCTVVGPAAAHSGRLAYNEAIIETDNRQMLLVVVRNRYGERSNLLAVASVTANVRVTTSAGIEAGVGDSDNYSGNLVPFRAGVLYEENPTISYTPVGGEQYARQMMSPVAVTSLATLANNLADPTPVYYALVSGVNRVYNPDFMPPSSAPDERFVRVVTIMRELALAHCLHWIQDSRQSDSFSIIIDHYSPHHADEVNELLTLLGISTPDNPSSRITLPVSLALEGQDSGGIGITTRRSSISLKSCQALSRFRNRIWPAVLPSVTRRRAWWGNNWGYATPEPGPKMPPWRSSIVKRGSISMKQTRPPSSFSDS